MQKDVINIPNTLKAKIQRKKRAIPSIHPDCGQESRLILVIFCKIAYNVQIQVRI